MKWRHQSAEETQPPSARASQHAKTAQSTSSSQTPTYNDRPQLDSAQLAAVATLGFEKRNVNFGRDFAPGELDSDSLASFLLECFAEVFGITDPAMLELSVNR